VLHDVRFRIRSKTVTTTRVLIATPCPTARLVFKFGSVQSSIRLRSPFRWRDPSGTTRIASINMAQASITPQSGRKLPEAVPSSLGMFSIFLSFSPSSYKYDLFLIRTILHPYFKCIKYYRIYGFPYPLLYEP
jgi:hypothetical protein